MKNYGSIIQDVLRAKYSGCEYVCGETYESLTWMPNNKTPKPSREQIELDISDYETNKNKYDWQLLRNSEYPKTSEKLNALWESMVNGNHKPLDEIKQKIVLIDAKYPSPT